MRRCVSPCGTVRCRAVLCSAIRCCALPCVAVRVLLCNSILRNTSTQWPNTIATPYHRNTPRPVVTALLLLLLLLPLVARHAGRFAEIQAPVGLTRGPDGHVYTTSYVSNSVARHDWKTGEFTDIYASGGDLVGPAALAFASARVLFICSYDNDKVVLYNSTAQITYTLPRRWASRD